MSIKRLLSPIAATMMLLSAFACLTGCNSDPTEYDDPNYIRGSELIVTNFTLQADSKIMSNLDSVYFAIDLNRCVIFNADSLPVGTPVNKLIPVISISSTVEKAEIVMEDEDGSRNVVDYLKNPKDTIDFTKRVTLELATMNGSATRIYSIKVNVHKMDPDSLCFDLDSKMALPSRMASPKRQKTTSRDGKVYSFITEADNSYTIASTAEMEKGIWTKQAIAPGFTPAISTFTATPDAFFILDAEGGLHTSSDAISWNDVTTSSPWISIVGAFGSRLQGIRADGETYLHTQYPLDGFKESAIPADFPYTGFTSMSLYTTKWSSEPLGLITGGRTANGYTGHTWAFNGTEWCDITDIPLPAVWGGAMIPYYAYLRSTSLWVFNEYSIWIYLGGMTADGKPNRKVYLTYDNGVHWYEAPQGMQLPEALDCGFMVDHAVIDTPLEADFAPEVWQSIGADKKINSFMRKLPYVIDGYRISWNCPFIYLIGGYPDDTDLSLNPWIYRGVINRMRFQPLI